LQRYLDVTLNFMERTTGSIHGHHTAIPSPDLPDFFAQAPNLLNQLTLAGLKNWVEYGIRNYRTHPERQKDYFSLQSADARAVLQRERHGTLLVDVEHKLVLYLRGLWQDGDQLVLHSTAFDELRKPIPYYDTLGIRLPDVYDDAGEVSDIVAHDERLLIEDDRQAVKEFDQQGIFSYCISLDPKADEYAGDIFGRQFTVIDHIERLPQLFMALSK
jgi:hypothetical protein